ncbi:hypothetical protein [Actinoplanes sp. ATCC 53533]|uniref:hypothetical protein n=1 Tax=Actinoplanes sp. ATCC 53533 TaxID=1288362 RepID=UPI001315481B|nr:hypothetical protein [Actinoplanes sp. ATCC 53533]
MAEKTERQIARLDEQITHERAKLGDLADTHTFLAWGQDSIAAATSRSVAVAGSGRPG